MSVSIAIVGAGLMGTGLARLFRRVDWAVAVYDRDGAATGRLCDAVAGVRAAHDLADLVTDADLAIEAAAEIAAVKQALFATLATVTGPQTILATNSSVIPVGVVARDVPDSEAVRVLGTHFWNPPDVIPLVEVIAGLRTGVDAIERTMAILTAAGKEPVHVRRDVVPGNRLQHALWREAIALVDEGVCSPEDIDHIVKRSFGLRLPVLGPLENADLVGLDLTRQIHEVVFPTLSKADGPPPALCDRVDAEQLGVKTGDGFYTGWTPDRVTALRERLARHLAAMLHPKG